MYNGVLGYGRRISKCVSEIVLGTPYSIVGGLPAVVLKQRFQEEDIIVHEKMLEERGVLIAGADAK